MCTLAKLKITVEVVRKVHFHLCKLNCMCFEMAEHSTKPHYETNDAEIKGFLLKWTNYIKGYQRRWFVLSNGVLSYYRCDFTFIKFGGNLVHCGQMIIAIGSLID